MKMFFTFAILAMAGIASATIYPSTPQPQAMGFTMPVSGDGSTTACLMAWDGTTTTTGATTLTTASTILTVPISEPMTTTCTLTMFIGTAATRYPLGSYLSLDLWQMINPDWTAAQCALARANMLAAMQAAGFNPAQIAAGQTAIATAIKATYAQFRAAHQAAIQAQAAQQAAQIPQIISRQ